MPAWLRHDQAEEPGPVAREPPPSNLFLLLKFLLHGFLLWAIFLVVSLLWLVLLFVLVICGYILGLVLALVILVALYGWVNSKVTRWLWFDVEESGWMYLFQGVLLLILTFVGDLILIVAGALAPWTASGLVYNYLFFQAPLAVPAVLVPALVLHFIVVGYFGRAAAAVWQREPPPEEPAEDTDAT